MSPRPALAVVLSTLALAACSGPYLSIGDSPGGAASASPPPSWAGEAHALRDLAGLSNLIVVGVALTTLWLLSQVAHRGLRFAWRLGIDPERRLASWLGAVQLAFAAVAIYLLVARFLDAAPAFALWTLALIIGASVVVLGRPLQSLWAGMMLRLRLREGDRISVAGHTGLVRAVGLVRTEVLAEDGSTLLVPNRVVAQEVVTVEPGHGAASVRVRVQVDAAGLADVGERLRRIAVLSPYRAPGTPVVVTPDDEAKGAWVEIQVWSLGAVRPAERHLAGALAAPLRVAEVQPRSRGGEGDQPANR